MGKLWGGAAFHDVHHLSEKAAARGLLELEAIWEMKRDRLIVRERGGKVARTTEMGSGVLFDTVFWAPDLVFVGAHAAGHTVAAAAEAAPTALGAVGDAAGSVFETILEIVAGIFG